MKLSWQPKRLLLKETFSISYGNYDFRDALLISLSYKDKTGFGECVAINYYGINLDEFILKLKEIQTKIEAKEIVHPKEFYQFLTSLNLHSFLCSALDCAYWDLYGKLENKSFSQLNYLISSNLPESSYTISIALVDEQIQKIQNSDWQKFKVKCNGLHQNYTFKLLETGKQIALDSNTSFSDDDCNFLQNNELTRNFLYIEQPRPVGEFQVLNKNILHLLCKF